MSCKCQNCGKMYKVDVIVNDKLWEKIKPIGAGLLCGTCIFNKIESLNICDVYFLKS